MHQISIITHHENGTWWAESDDLPGFSAAADTFEELKTLVFDGVDFYVEENGRLRGFALDIQPAELNAWTRTPTRGSAVLAKAQKIVTSFAPGAPAMSQAMTFGAFAG